MLTQPPVPQKTVKEIFEKYEDELQKPKKIISHVPGEIIEIPQFFSSELCQELIEATEKIGYQQALITTGVGIGFIDKSVRDSERVMIDDFPTAEYLYPFLLKYAPLCSEGAYCIGVNERFRYLKYGVNGLFAEHCDGRFPKTEREFSMYTTHFYLNNVEKGGGTSFYFDRRSTRAKEGGLTVNSCENKLVIFRQRGWLHQGDTVEKGLKYTVRNELMYRYLDNEEIEQLKIKECYLCKKYIQAVKYDDCEHQYVKCRCPMFNSDKQDWKDCKPRCYICKDTPITYKRKSTGNTTNQKQNDQKSNKKNCTIF